ncbi:Aste57867_5216 [Aphanomyces stellatus]|uniref:Aste57867_5216 protein n=1 Tax=Aphanomyces stellatus TaxID=120398 RepID=A0A485KF75_9STRA|nr:hypothetical protein As57867_005203 [Aphanomyces stellatus]VFT82289.1 Aste57867_5216 [Aphanomyces stellatus]
MPAREWFIPYVYEPSPESEYVEIVTHLGSIKVPLSLTQFYGFIVAIAIGFITLFAAIARAIRDEDKEDEFDPVPTKEAPKKRAKKPHPLKTPAAAASAEAKSALEENILKNGENSYYYAHKVREISAESTRVRQVISTYGWSDGAKSVTIYVNHPDAASLDAGKIQMEWTPTSLSLDISFDAEDVRSLVVPTLFAEISGMTYKLKKDAIAFTLKKKELVAWKSLNGAVKNIEDHVEYDDSLYD